MSDRVSARKSNPHRDPRHDAPGWLLGALGLALACGVPAQAPAVPPEADKVEIAMPATLPSGLPTDTWQTRRVEPGGYSIRFPPDAEATSGASPSTLMIVLKNTVTIEGVEESVGHDFKIVVHPNQKGQSAIEWAVERLIEPAPDFVREREPLLVDGLPAYRVANFAFDQRDQHVIVARGAWIYEMEWDEDISIFPDEVGRENRRVHEAMVASFRFLNPPN